MYIEIKVDFLVKWFRAVYPAESLPKDQQEHPGEWQQQQIIRADRQSRTIIEFLNKEENKTVQELAAVPMLLQIMAIIWKNRQYLPRTRESQNFARHANSPNSRKIFFNIFDK